MSLSSFKQIMINFFYKTSDSNNTFLQNIMFAPLTVVISRLLPNIPKISKFKIFKLFIHKPIGSSEYNIQTLL